MSINSRLFFIVLVFFTVTIYSCKSSFEKVRTSNEPEKILVEANKFYDEEKYMNAQILYEIILPFYKGKKEADDLFYKFAYTYYHLKDYMVASHYFKSYASSFSNSPKREECLYMTAYSEYLMSPNKKLEQSQTLKAIEDFQVFVNTFPNSDKVEKCNQLIDEMRLKMEEKEYSQGELYYNLGKYVSAIVAFENMLKEYPETKKEEEVRLMILKSSYNYAKNSIFEKRLERYEDTIAKYNSYIKRYPESKEKTKAEKIYQNSLNEINKIKNGYKI
ncbi:MAG: outer membrane protein assembly factor BamD [Saprospiraceae bacterium]|nr:outer membrane protein assembly factor BamD [Saprospiraceae bacterium]